MKSLIKWAVVVSNVFLLVACSPPMPDLELDSTRNAANKQHFKWEERKPLRKVKLSGGFFISKQLDSNLPKKTADTPIAIKFPNRTATLGDIVFLLEQKGFPVSYNWTLYEDTSRSSSSGGMSSGSDEDMDLEGMDSFADAMSGDSDDPISAIEALEKRIIPFKSYKGTLKGLLNRVKRSMNISYWYEDDTIFFSTNQEYVVSVPQQKDIITSITSEIEALGATDVTSSLTAGQIVYYAKPRAQDNLIKPFLQRISHNLSEITLQVALVQVTIEKNESKGFDWDAFDVGFTAPSVGTENTSDVTVSPYNGDSGNPAGSIAGSFFRKGISIFGTRTDVTIETAINILSTVGKTTTEQNVEMRTISGKEVTLESVEEQSYVSGYDGGSYGDNPEPPSPEFDTVETGLILTFLPVFDAYNSIVTIDSSISLSSVTGVTEVDAGGEFGQVTTRPNVSENSFEDIVRIPLGETVIVGGITSEIFSDKRTAPMGMWGVNSAKLEGDKQALFMIIRPLVTLYETDGNELPVGETDILKQSKYNYGKAVEKRAEDEQEAKEAAAEAAAKKAADLKAVQETVEAKAKALQIEKDKKEAEEAKVQAKLEKMRERLEKEHQKEIKLKEKEALKLREEVEEHKKAREVLEAESAWEEGATYEIKEYEEYIEVEEVVEIKIIEEETLDEDEAEKIKLLNMLRGIKS